MVGQKQNLAMTDKTANSSRVAIAGPADREPLISACFGRFIWALAGKAFSTGTAWCIDGNLGGALWLPPGVTPYEQAVAAILDESVPRDVMADVTAMFSEMAAYRPRDPHWYLPTIGARGC